MHECTKKPKSPMGKIQKKFRKVFVVIHGINDDIQDVFPVKNSFIDKKLYKYHKKSKESGSDDSYERTDESSDFENPKTKNFDFSGGLTTDAIPSPRLSPKQGSSPTKSPASRNYSDIEEDDSLKPKIEDVTDDNVSEYSDMTCEGEYEDDTSSLKSEKSVKKKKKKRFGFLKRKSASSPESEKVCPFQNSPEDLGPKHGIQIIGSKNIHIGPTYEQRVYINYRDPERQSPTSQVKASSEASIEASSEINALMSDLTPVSTELLHFISQHIGHKWKYLGRSFGYSEGQLEQFESNWKLHQEVVYQLLRDWMQVETDDATNAKLSKALWQIDEKEAVERLALFVLNKSSISD